MAPPKQFPPRPETPFRISSVSVLIDIVATHTKAGFDPIADGTVREHFSQYLDFLRNRGYLLENSAAMKREELWSNDLTLAGYRFVQYSEGKWLGRLYKRRTHDQESRFLERWHEAFLALPPTVFP